MSRTKGALCGQDTLSCKIRPNFFAACGKGFLTHFIGAICISVPMLVLALLIKGTFGGGRIVSGLEADSCCHRRHTEQRRVRKARGSGLLSV